MKTILIRYGEIALKKGNRNYFVKLLLNNIKAKLPDVKIEKEYGRIYLKKEYFDNQDLEKLKMIPGIYSFSEVVETNTDIDNIKELWVKIIEDYLKNVLNLTSGKTITYKFSTKRADKSYPIHSDIFSIEVGKYVDSKINEKIKRLEFKAKHPEIVFFTEIREKKAYLFFDKIKCVGGLPVGVSGKGLALLSGGIDSPVASFMMMKRGMAVDFIHFHSPPYTSDMAKQKVIDLAKVLKNFENKARLYIVPFTEIQLAIRKNSDVRYLTLLMRRAMVKIAEKVANSKRYNCLITGESLGQVASQAIDSIVSTANATNKLVLRPLIGFDKEEIVEISKKIGTFDISTEPYEDCCTVFVPRHPETKPKIHKVIEEENKYLKMGMIEKAVENIEIIEI